MMKNIYDRLNMLHQEHIVSYMKTLPPDRRAALAEQINDLDLSMLENELSNADRGRFEPLSAMTLSEIATKREQFTQTGLRSLRACRVGAVLLAGGQGSRLGFDHPKGMYRIGIERELYIFECLINNMFEVVRAADAWIPLFVMTSAENHAETECFFREHNWFGYNPAHIFFFEQEQLPILDLNRKLVLSGSGRIVTAPNGNGGWYASMAKNGILQHVKELGIEWLNVFAVDNVLQRIADPCFIGAVVESGMVSGAKVVAKADPDEKVGVLCLEDGRPSIVEYFEMTDEMRTRRRPDGTLAYYYGVILNYLFRVDQLDSTISVRLPLHCAQKKVTYEDADGNLIRPEEPNAYKFETLALDMVKMQDNCLAYEVERSREFAPVKNRTGVDSVEAARKLLLQNGVIL